LKQENEEMKKRLLGDKAEKTKVITISGRSKTNTTNPEREDEVLFQTGKTSTLHERRHPFVDEIVNVELPPKWRGLSIDRYDGSTDPDEHMDVYTIDIRLFTTSEASMCRVFPNSLKGMELSWFTKPPPYSIDSFKTLVSLFTMQFATSRPHHLTSIALVNIRQGRNESLRALMDRFNQVALQIRNLNSEVALHHMVTALRPGPFVDSLCKKPALDMNKTRVRATKFMLLEELRDFEGSTKVEHQVIPHQQDKARMREKPSFPPPLSRPREIRLPKFTTYTPLNANRGRILEEALRTDILPIPRRTATPKNADTTKHCRFHQNYGHTTEECMTLKDKIEKLIQAGHLRQFVRGQPEVLKRQRTPERRREPRNEPRPRTGERARTPQCTPPQPANHNTCVRGVINTVAGGFSGGGSSASARKKHIRAVQAVIAVSMPIR